MDDIDPSQVPPAVFEAVRYCQSHGRWPLYLWGATGTGKSCAAAELYCRWTGSAYWNSLSGISELLRAFAVNPVQYITSGSGLAEVTLASFWRKMSERGLLVVDEIGTREATPHRYDAFRDLLEARKGKPFIITGNVEPKFELAKLYDERIQSRIVQGVLLEIRGGDRRVRGLAQRIRISDEGAV